MLRERFSLAVGTCLLTSSVIVTGLVADPITEPLVGVTKLVPFANTPTPWPRTEQVSLFVVPPKLPVMFLMASPCADNRARPLSTPLPSSHVRKNSPLASGITKDGKTKANCGYVVAENDAPLNFMKTISAHSGITVFGMAAEGQKNGIPMGGAPAPKPTFKRL